MLNGWKIGCGAALALAVVLVGCKREEERQRPATSPPELRETPPAPDERRETRDIERLSGAATMDAREFVNQAASGGQFEVQTADLMTQKATDDQMKPFAQQMRDEHARVNNELKEIAQRKNIPVPEQMLPKHQQMLDRLRNAEQDDQTRMYHDQQVQAHDETIALFERAARELTDPDLKAFAERTLPTLREHRAHLQGHTHEGAASPEP
jgi:putative membrane protein